jgi:hypothetical protein
MLKGYTVCIVMYVFVSKDHDSEIKYKDVERNFEELNPASHVPILGTILNIFDVFVAVFFLSVKFFESCGTTDNF